MRIFAVQPLSKDKTAAIIIIQSEGTYLQELSHEFGSLDRAMHSVDG
jgi:hypothetical protein